MKKWYEVVTCFFDDGKVTSSIVSVVTGGTRPENHVWERRDKDIYYEFYESERAAIAAVEAARRISSK